MGVCCFDNESEIEKNIDTNDITKKGPKLFGQVHGGEESDDSDNVNDPIESKSLKINLNPINTKSCFIERLRDLVDKMRELKVKTDKCLKQQIRLKDEVASVSKERLNQYDGTNLKNAVNDLWQRTS